MQSRTSPFSFLLTDDTVKSGWHLKLYKKWYFDS